MSVIKRGEKGVFYMNFMVQGVRIYRTTGKYTRKEAKQVEAIERQKLIDHEKMTPQEKAAKKLLLDAIDCVYENRWTLNKDADRTYARAKNMAALIGNLPLSKIDEHAVTAMLQKLDKIKSAPGTVNRYLATLKTVMLHFKQPVDHIKLRKERKGRIRVVSKDEEFTVLSLLRNTHHDKRRYFYPDVADLFECLLDTGCRLSELLDLTYNDINFEANLISIWLNKGDRPRSIPMTARVQAILKARQKINAIRPFDIKPYQAENAWRWVRKQMGLENDREYVLHAARHTCGSRLVNADVNLYVVKEYLGHSTIQVTEKYAHLAPAKLAHAASVLENQ